jgi:hypothetical protein
MESARKIQQLSKRPRQHHSFVQTSSLIALPEVDVCSGHESMLAFSHFMQREA